MFLLYISDRAPRAPTMPARGCVLLLGPLQKEVHPGEELRFDGIIEIPDMNREVEAEAPPPKKKVWSSSVTPRRAILEVSPTLALGSEMKPIEQLVVHLREPIATEARELHVSRRPTPHVPDVEIETQRNEGLVGSKVPPGVVLDPEPIGDLDVHSDEHQRRESVDQISGRNESSFQLNIFAEIEFSVHEQPHARRVE